MSRDGVSAVLRDKDFRRVADEAALTGTWEVCKEGFRYCGNVVFGPAWHDAKEVMVTLDWWGRGIPVPLFLSGYDLKAGDVFTVHGLQISQ